MEAAPKLPFINFPLKTSIPESPDFGTKLKQYIRNQYGEEHEAYSKEIREIEGLRQSACLVPRDFTGCCTLKKYYSQLHLLQSRFPMKDGEAASVTFTWSDAYASPYTGVPYALANIKYEQGCILYNIGALHSELGAMDSRNSSEGMKMSCTHFQCAAWAFQQLRDGDFPKLTPDSSNSMLSFYINVMLGQAQECILEKSMLDNRKSTIVAKISTQIVEYYKQALKMVDETVTANVSSKLLKSWRKHLDFKMAYHSCVALLYMGNQAGELQKMGERVSYFQGALEKLNESSKLAKGLEKDVGDAITFTMDVVGGKLNAATKENEFVYHEKVPSLDSLPEIKGASLVKGVPFDPNDPEISGPDIFARLVPIEAHESSSMYSEEKARILRRITALINEKDEELKMYVSCLQLDQLRLLPSLDGLPQELVDCCAAMSVQPMAVKQLIRTMQDLSGKFHDVASLLNDIKENLDDEAKIEKEYQAITGPRPTSMIILEISKELSKYQEAYEKAGESNITLHKAMDYHIANLNLLSGSLDDLSQSLPSIGALNLSDNFTAKELQRLSDKVTEMQNQRQMLEVLLRDQLQSDDITKKLVTTDNQSLKDLFAKELKKHDQQVTYIEQNLAAQDNVLKALTEANARYADSRKALNEIIQRRDTMIRSLCSSYEAYEDLNAKSQKGLEFYNKLEANVLKLSQRLKSVCSVQEEERATILKKKQPKKDINEKLMTDTGPKLKDFLKSFGNPQGMAVGRDLMKRGDIPSVPGYSSTLNETYVPQSYSNIRQQSESHVPTSNNLTLSNLPSELRLPPVGSEKSEPTSYKPSFQAQPYSAPPVSVEYSSGYVDHHFQPANREIYNNQNHKAEGYAAAEPQRHMGNYIPGVIETPSSYNNHSSWYQQVRPSQLPTMNTPNINKNEQLNLAPQMIQQPTHPYGLNGAVNYPIQQPAAVGNTGAYNSTANYTPTTAAAHQIGYEINNSTASYCTPVASTVASNIYPPYQYSQQLPTAHSHEYGIGVQQGYNRAQPVNSYQSTSDVGYNSSTMTPAAYSQPPQQQFSSHQARTLEPQLQPNVLHYQASGGISQATIAPPQSVNDKPQASTLSSNVELLKQLDLTNFNFNDVPAVNRAIPDRSSKPAEILKPKVMNVEDFIKQNDAAEKEMKRDVVKDPFTEAFLEKFVLEVERFQKTVEGLTKQSLNGPTPLEQKWKELSDAQDRESRKLSISVARCYSMKNRVPDIMPYDSNRILLTSSNDDYINASYLKNLSKNTAQYIATQAPVASTYRDLWAMVYEQQAEIVVTILSDAELRGDIYWPKEKGFSVDHGHLTVSLRNVSTKIWGVERLISITHRESKISRAVMHLQFTGWPPGGIPSSPVLFLHFVNDVHVHFSNQRNSLRPIVVHCSAGVGRTGVFCLVSTAVHEVNAGTGIIDLWALAARMVLMRKYTMQDKEHMKFALYAVLYYAEDCLLKRGILIKRTNFEDKVPGSAAAKSHTRHPSQDFLLTKLADEQSGELVPNSTSELTTDDVDKNSVVNRSRSGSTTSVASHVSSGSGPIATPPPMQGYQSNVQSPAHKPNGSSGKTSQLPMSLSNLDPENFSLDLMAHTTKKITKQSFFNPSVGGVKDRQLDPSDPLSQLDPLWNLHN